MNYPNNPEEVAMLMEGKNIQVYGLWKQLKGLAVKLPQVAKILATLEPQLQKALQAADTTPTKKPGLWSGIKNAMAPSLERMKQGHATMNRLTRRG